MNPILRTLDAGKNHIGNVKGIGNALKENKAFSYLKLFKNEIGEEGGKTIGEVPKVNTELSWLILDNNNLGCKARRAIGEGLKPNMSKRNS